MSRQKNEYKVFSETISMQAKMILLMFSIDNDGEDKNIEISAKLSETYNELKDLEFCQTHQGYIVNLRKINRIDDGMIMLTNGDKVPISVRKRAEVIAQYADFIEKNT